MAEGETFGAGGVILIWRFLTFGGFGDFVVVKI